MKGNVSAVLSDTLEFGAATNAVSVPIESTPAPVSAAPSGALAANAREVVLEVMAEKTGYEPDMIEDEMELEAELGIDSIKRVEILSDVQAKLNVEAKNVEALSRTRTVGEVIEAMMAEIGSVGGGVSMPSSSAAPVSNATSVPAPVSAAPSGALAANASEVVLEVMAEKTGYEPDMIEDEMELEAELGIDSIKRVEILSDVQSKLNVEAKNVEALSRTRTVGEVIEAMMAEIGSVGGGV